MFNREEFIEYFRNEEKMALLSADDKVEVFLGVLPRQSDLDKELIEELCINYDAILNKKKLKSNDILTNSSLCATLCRRLSPTKTLPCVNKVLLAGGPSGTCNDLHASAFLWSVFVIPGKRRRQARFRFRECVYSFLDRLLHRSSL